MSPTQKSIVDRLRRGEHLAAQSLCGPPSCPVWIGAPGAPSANSVQSLYRRGVVVWAGKPPKYPERGRLVLASGHAA